MKKRILFFREVTEYMAIVETPDSTTQKGLHRMREGRPLWFRLVERQPGGLLDAYVSQQTWELVETHVCSDPPETPEASHQKTEGSEDGSRAT